MKKDEVKIGTTYRVKVSGNVQDVRITGENAHGGWDGVNVTTNRKVRIKSPQRLRAVAQPRPAKRKTIMSLAEYEAEAKAATGAKAAAGSKASKEHMRATHPADQENARLADERAASGDGQTASERAMAESAPAAKKAGKATKEPKAAAGRDTGERAATSGEPKRLSALNAAVKVLEERDPADGPLSCAQMIERMAAKGYWTPARGGLTPANTLYAAVLREIKTKGEDSRFEKVERGKFTLSLKR